MILDAFFCIGKSINVKNINVMISNIYVYVCFIF